MVCFSAFISSKILLGVEIKLTKLTLSGICYFHIVTGDGYKTVTFDICILLHIGLFLTSLTPEAPI